MYIYIIIIILHSVGYEETRLLFPAGTVSRYNIIIIVRNVINVVPVFNYNSLLANAQYRYNGRKKSRTEGEICVFTHSL